MTNYKLQITNYFKEWWLIMARPIYFFAVLKDELWQEKPLTFLMITAWLLAAVATLVIFCVQYIPIGSTLVEGITGYKFLIILPVLLTLIFVFFVITVLILGGVFIGSLFAAGWLAALVLHYIYTWLGGKGKLARMVQGSFYSVAAAALPVALLFGLMVMTKYGGLDYQLFMVGGSFLLFLIALFLYGLWAIAGRRDYRLSKTKAFAGALLPFFVLLIFVFIFDKIVFSKLQPWIT